MSGAWLDAQKVADACLECIKDINDNRWNLGERYLDAHPYTVWTWKNWIPRPVSVRAKTKQEYLENTCDDWASWAWAVSVSLKFETQEKIAHQLLALANKTDEDLFVTTEDFFYISSYYKD